MRQKQLYMERDLLGELTTLEQKYCKTTDVGVKVAIRNSLQAKRPAIRSAEERVSGRLADLQDEYDRSRSLRRKVQLLPLIREAQDTLIRLRHFELRSHLL